MKGRKGKISRRQRAVPLIERHILTWEETLATNLAELKVFSKGKDQTKLDSLKTIVKFCEKKLNAHKECLENTKRNLN